MCRFLALLPLFALAACSAPPQSVTVNDFADHEGRVLQGEVSYMEIGGEPVRHGSMKSWYDSGQVKAVVS